MEDAIKEYELIIKQGYFRVRNSIIILAMHIIGMNRLHRPILSYERAAQLRPNDPDIIHKSKARVSQDNRSY